MPNLPAGFLQFLSDTYPHGAAMRALKHFAETGSIPETIHDGRRRFTVRADYYQFLASKA